MRELDATVSPEELEEWKAYWQLEPFGSLADDVRWRQMFALYFSANSKPDTPLPNFLDWDPEETERRRAEAAAEVTLEDKLLAWFGPRATTSDQTTVEDDQLSLPLDA